MPYRAVGDLLEGDEKRDVEGDEARLGLVLCHCRPRLLTPRGRFIRPRAQSQRHGLLFDHDDDKNNKVNY